MAGFKVTSVTGDEQLDSAQNLVDVYDVTFQIDNGGTYTVTVPQGSGAVDAAKAAIDEIVSQVEGIMAL